MEDEEVLNRIRTLVDEEHSLRGAGEPVDPERLSELETTLDQCWDLLRQRRAHREFGQDESSAAARDARTVEHYEQ
ncbi:MAG TPA: DUF2630 family protein [Acidimicrobiales bacterium]|nr:DUF2630 family protein [Acidimicrobiales bacterium]